MFVLLSSASSLRLFSRYSRRIASLARYHSTCPYPYPQTSPLATDDGSAPSQVPPTGQSPMSTIDSMLRSIRPSAPVQLISHSSILRPSDSVNRYGFAFICFCSILVRTYSPSSGTSSSRSHRLLLSSVLTSTCHPGKAFLCPMAKIAISRLPLSNTRVHDRDRHLDPCCLPLVHFRT